MSSQPTSLNKVSMSLDDIINSSRQNKKSFEIVKGKSDNANKSKEEPLPYKRRNYFGKDRKYNNYESNRGSKPNVRAGFRGNRGSKPLNFENRDRDNNMVDKRNDRGFKVFRKFNNFNNSGSIRRTDRDGRESRYGTNRNNSQYKPRYPYYNNQRRNYNNSKNFLSDYHKRRLYVSNLHKDIINSELKNIFSRVGQLKRCGIHWDSLGNSKGTADVEYERAEDAKKAIEEFDNAEIDGTPMRVNYSKNVGRKRRIFRLRLGIRTDHRVNRRINNNMK